MSKTSRLVIALCGVILLGLGGMIAFAYAATPPNILHPQMTHYHVRLQILVDGNAVNFGDKQFQTPYDADICSGALTESPIHFHDAKDQFVHVHWQGITGGELLKNYGWDFIGGLPHALGYRVTSNWHFQKVREFGSVLPKQPQNAQFYVYVGDETRFESRTWDDFLNKPLDEFLGKPQKKSSGIHLFSTAQAAEETQQEKLTRINNLLGNIVIFVQKDKPTDDQVKARFQQLVPLPESTCGG